MTTATNFPDRKTAHAYLTGECGRKLSPAKFYADVKKGSVLQDRAGGFTRRTLDNYATTLARVSGLPAKDQDRAAKASLRKQEASARREEEHAMMLRRKREILEGKYLSKSLVYQILAARAAMLQEGLVSMVEVDAPLFVEAVQGEPTLAGELSRLFEERLQNLLSDYAATAEFVVEIDMSDLAALDAMTAGAAPGGDDDDD